MPRAVMSPAATIVNYFRTANREVADLVMSLCKDALKERDAKVAKIRQGVAKGKKQGKGGKQAAAAAEVPPGDVNAQADATTRSATATRAPRRRNRGNGAAAGPAAVETQPELPVEESGVEEAPAGEEAPANV